MLNTLLFVFLFFLPAGIANMAPVFAARLPGLRNWNTAMDGGMVWRGKRLLGANKTLRGFIFGIAAAVVTNVIIFTIIQNNDSLAVSLPANYTNSTPVLLGLLLGAGALTGDALKSFLKRQLEIPPGKPWFPFDQLDYIIGAVLFTVFYVPLQPVEYALLFGLGFVLHLTTVYIGYLTNIREQAI